MRTLANADIKTSVKPNFTANVMAPLHVDNMNEFEEWLAAAQSMGIDAVSVDVWWGDVEKNDNVFNWTYYDTLFAKIKRSHLKIVPIVSFHQCGGNVGYLQKSFTGMGMDKRHRHEI